jgi:hypothetical protein
MTRSPAPGKRLSAVQRNVRIGQGKSYAPDTRLPDWLFDYAARLSCMSWIILTIILRHTQQRGGQPASISFRRFVTESGLSSMSVAKALDELASIGLLYRERDIPHQRTSTIRYAIRAEPGNRPHETAEGLVIALLGVTYPIDPARLLPEEVLRPVGGDSLPPIQRFSLEDLQQRLKHLPPLRGPATINWPALRERVFLRDNYTCFYCGRTDFFPLHCDHVVPPERGGQARDPGNLVTACGSCNASKRALTLEEWLG